MMVLLHFVPPRYRKAFVFVSNELWALYCLNIQCTDPHYCESDLHCTTGNSLYGSPDTLALIHLAISDSDVQNELFDS